MRSVVLERKREIRIREMEINETLDADSVRINPLSVGICGSDVHYYLEGRIGSFVVNQPMVLGHEASGVVTETGSNVSHVSVGDRVCVEPGIPDFKSPQALGGRYNIDPDVRFWATPPVHGCLRESIVHPASLAFKLPDNMTDEEGALVEPAAVGVYSAKRAAIIPGDTALVIGAGTIGIMTALAAAGGGCGTVILADIKNQKLDFVGRHYPGKITCAYLKETAIETVFGELGIPGADVVFEASGSQEVFGELPKYAAPGGRIVLIGMPPGPVAMDVVAMQAKELSVETVFRYVNTFPRVVKLISSGRLDVKPLITKRYRVKDSVEAFRYAATQPDSEVKMMIKADF